MFSCWCLDFYNGTTVTNIITNNTVDNSGFLGFYILLKMSDLSPLYDRALILIIINKITKLVES